MTDDDYLEGSPELIVEISASSASYDLHDKRRAYARNGVPEYLVIQTYEQKVDWFVLRDGVYQTLKPADDGVLKSEVFPGLWLQPDAIWSRDLSELLRVGREGLVSEEHEAFAATLREAAQQGAE